MIGVISLPSAPCVLSSAKRRPDRLSPASSRWCSRCTTRRCPGPRASSRCSGSATHSTPRGIPCRGAQRKAVDSGDEMLVGAAKEVSADAADHPCCRILTAVRQLPDGRPARLGLVRYESAARRQQVARNARGCDSLTALLGCPLSPTQRIRRADELGDLSWSDERPSRDGLRLRVYGAVPQSGLVGTACGMFVRRLGCVPSRRMV